MHGVLATKCEPPRRELLDEEKGNEFFFFFSNKFSYFQLT